MVLQFSDSQFHHRKKSTEETDYVQKNRLKTFYRVSDVEVIMQKHIYSFFFIFQRSVRQQQRNARADRWIAIFGSAGQR